MTTTRLLCLGPLALALASAAMLTACGGTAPAPLAETVRPALVAEVRAGGADRLAFVGEVRATRRAEPAFAVSGRVAAVLAEPGDAVRAGQVLARLDEQPLKAQLAAAAADAARARSQLAEARQRAERLHTAQQAGATSAAETGAVQAELAAAEAAQRAADAQQELAAWSLRQAVLTAPVDGVVGARSVEVGQAAGPGAPAFSIDGAGRELSLLLPAALALKPGQPLVLRSDGSEAASRVLRVAGRLEAGGLRRVFVGVPAQAAVGSTWSAVIGLPGPAAVPQVPLRAVLPGQEAGTGTVLRLAADGTTVETVAVRLGGLHGDWVDVSQGLATGDRVVVAGAAAIAPGSRVRPMPFAGGGR